MLNSEKINVTVGHWLKAVLATYAAVQSSGLIVAIFFLLITGDATFTDIYAVIFYGFMVTVMPTAIYACLLSSIAVKLARNPHAFQFILVIAIVCSLVFFLLVALLSGGIQALTTFDSDIYILLYNSLIAGALGGLAAVASVRYTLSKAEERG